MHADSNHSQSPKPQGTTPHLRESVKSADERDPKTYAIIGATMDVHRELGHGFLEAVYQEALAIELTKRGIPFQREVELSIRYKDQLLKTKYRADFVCYGSVVVETKALSQLTGADQAQVINELKATGMGIGLLINFGAPSLEYRRLVFTLKNNLRESAQSADT
jgi:GxxExxY protein